MAQRITNHGADLEAKDPTREGPPRPRGVQADYRFSSERITRIVGAHYLDQDTLDRWAELRRGIEAMDEASRERAAELAQELDTEVERTLDAVYWFGAGPDLEGWKLI
jgi:hypothetical protein